MNARKQQLRQELILLRQAMSKDAAATKSKLIADKALSCIVQNSVGRLHIYSPITAWHEIDTSHIKATVAEKWPDIEAISPLPAKNQPIPTEKFDLIIVPVLGFDQEKYRLGYGGGWYDRFLATQKQALTIGLAYSFAEIPDLPHEPHDIPLDIIVTEKETI